MSKAECIWPVGAILGEGPLWREQERSLYFVDIKGKRVHRWQQMDGARKSWGLSEMVGWLVPCRQSPGLLAGLHSGIAYLEFASPALNLRWLHRLHAPGSTLRLNDAKADAHGNLWFGSMDHVQEGNPVGELFRLDVRGKIERFDTGYGVTNGPAFSPDGKILYHTDSAARRIYAFDLDTAGLPSNKRVWLQFEPMQGYPDGMTTDAEGCVWIAHWDGACVTRWSPQAQLLQTIPVPVARPTSVALGGADFRTLFVTSARSQSAAAGDPMLQGGLFQVQVEVPGLPACAYAGRV